MKQNNNLKLDTNDESFIMAVNRECYDKLGRLYEDGASDLKIIIETGAWKDFLDALSGRSILNVGCGIGDASRLLIDNGYGVVNIDLSPVMISIAQEVCPEAKNLVLSATELDKLGMKFDGVVAIHLIQNLNKKMMTSFLKQVYDRLNRNGVLILVFTNTCFEKNGYQLEGGAVEGNMIWWNKWKLEDVAQLIGKVHFKPIKFYQQKYIEKSCGYMEPFVLICKKP